MFNFMFTRNRLRFTKPKSVQTKPARFGPSSTSGFDRNLNRKKVNSRFRFRLFSSHVLLWNARIHFKYYSTTGRWRCFSLEIFINILKGVSSDGLNKIVNFIYTGDVQIGMNDVEDVLDAATHLQMKHIVKDSFI